jgi:hypothetical protein
VSAHIVKHSAWMGLDASVYILEYRLSDYVLFPTGPNEIVLQPVGVRILFGYVNVYVLL